MPDAGASRKRQISGRRIAVLASAPNAAGGGLPDNAPDRAWIVSTVIVVILSQGCRLVLAAIVSE